MNNKIYSKLKGSLIITYIKLPIQKMYSRLPKIDTPKIDTFYEISRNFEKN